MFGNGTDPPSLTHTSDHAGNTEAEGNRRCDTVGKLLALIIVLRGVPAETTLEDEVIGDANAGVDGQPVGDEVHKVLQDELEVRIAGDGNGERDTRGEESPDETRNTLGPATEHLEGQGDGVDVGAVVGDDGEGEDDQAELAESTEGLEDGIDQATVTGGFPTSHVLVVSAIDFDGGDDGDTEEFGEDEGNDQTEPGGEEDLAATAVRGLVDSVVGGIAGPACRETVDGRTERQTIAQLRNSDVHGQVDKVTRVGEAAHHDPEHNKGGDPTVELVGMNDLVSGKGDEQGAEGDDEDTGVTGDSSVHSVEELRTDDGVGRRPTDTGNDVKDGDYLRQPN